MKLGEHECNPRQELKLCHGVSPCHMQHARSRWSGMRTVSLLVLHALVITCGANRIAVHTASAHDPHASQPGEYAMCGTWQDSYSKLHRSLLSGKKPSRYAISIPAPAGLSDRLLGTVTVFLYALLTDRAFQIAGNPSNLCFHVHTTLTFRCGLGGQAPPLVCDARLGVNIRASAMKLHTGLDADAVST